MNAERAVYGINSARHTSMTGWFPWRMRAATAALLTVLGGGAIFPPGAAAQDSPRPDTQSLDNGGTRGEKVQTTSRLLDDQQKKIEKEETRLQSLRKNQVIVETELKKVEQNLGKLAAAQNTIQAELTLLDSEGEARALAVEKAKIQRDRLAENLRQRLIAMYKTQRRSSSLIYLFRATSATDMLKRVTYLGRVAEFDRTYMKELTQVVESLESERSKLTEVKTKQQQKLDQLRAAADELETRRLKQAGLLREAKDQEKQIARSLEKLRSSARNMEALLASLTGQDGPLIVEELPPEVEEPQPTPAPPVTVPSQTKSPPKPTPVPQIKLAKVIPDPGVEPGGGSDFSGPGLTGLKGRLPFPVEGKVLQHFGKQRHEEFADILFIKGLEVAAAAGAKVRAVAPGKVVLNKSLPGFGKVVILDHGKRFYTLYGRLANGVRTLGDVVQAGEVIAELGEPDHRGRNFYFELRIRGKASDPGEYFSTRAKAK